MKKPEIVLKGWVYMAVCGFHGVIEQGIDFGERATQLIRRDVGLICNVDRFEQRWEQSTDEEREAFVGDYETTVREIIANAEEKAMIFLEQTA